jgi:hypothetical protein
MEYRNLYSMGKADSNKDKADNNNKDKVDNNIQIQDLESIVHQ